LRGCRICSTVSMNVVAFEGRQCHFSAMSMIDKNYSYFVIS